MRRRVKIDRRSIELEAYSGITVWDYVIGAALVVVPFALVFVVGYLDAANDRWW